MIGVDDARLGQGQRAGLVEYDGVDLGQRSIASPEFRITPARNSAPEATTCTAGIARPVRTGK